MRDAGHLRAAAARAEDPAHGPGHHPLRRPAGLQPLLRHGGPARGGAGGDRRDHVPGPRDVRPGVRGPLRGRREGRAGRPAEGRGGAAAPQVVLTGAGRPVREIASHRGQVAA
ncbi:hypothetical protein SBRY_90225 [Actinacidiphila bryophytorum]|uniref:Uncharacterized protein n=1 Tax=Actinacidiphila bryophytorum TaxID=1436133 RepID=A0A9W4MLF8_9ACTN|nr:hypothetical protein SBRY_90225 [Actinacidiphila bryophytorum]